MQRRQDMTDLIWNKRVVVSETVADEAIVINMESGSYHRIAGAASQLWNALAEGCAFDRWAEKAKVDLSVLTPAHLAALALSLGEVNLILLDDTGRAQLRNLADTAGSPLDPVESYDDMADLLLIDPIHDVDEHGWPEAQNTDATAEPEKT